jgi:hypothetical protein
MPRNEAAQIRLPVPRAPAHQPAPLWSAMIVVSLASPRRRQPTAWMSYPARSSGTGAGLARFVRWVRLAPPQTEFVSVGHGCQAGAWRWVIRALKVPGCEASLRVRPPDRCRSEPPRVSEYPDSPGGHSAPQSAPQNDLPETAQPHDQLQFPNRSGRSRHGHPAQVRKKIPSITSR